eukprot:gene6404-10411_t
MSLRSENDDKQNLNIKRQRRSGILLKSYDDLHELSEMFQETEEESRNFENASTSAEDFSVNLYSVYTVDEMRKAFISHLKKEQNLENFEFMEEVKKLETIILAKEQIQKLSELYETFIKVGAKKEINIYDNVRKKFHKKLKLQLSKENTENWILQESPVNVLKPIINSVNHVLFYDVFPRFVRSDNCHKILKKFPKDNRIWVSKKTLDFQFSNSDFYQQPFISQKDVKFLKSLMFDSFDWNLLNSSKKKDFEAILYSTDVNYLPNVDPFKVPSTAKFEFVFNHSFETCVLALTSMKSFLHLDPNMKHLKLVNYKEADEFKKEGYIVPDNYAMVEVEADMHFPFPVNEPRKMFYSIGFQYDPKTTTLYRIVKPHLPKSINPKMLFDKHKFLFKMGTSKPAEELDCRLFFVYSLIAIKKLNDDQILFTQINYYDTSMLSKFTKFLFEKSIVVKRGLNLGKGISDHLNNFHSKMKENINIYESFDEQDGCHKAMKFLNIPEIEQQFWDSLGQLEIKQQTKMLYHMLNNKDSLLLFDCTDNSVEGLKSIINQI